jgi:hypothetical protein
MSSYAGMGAFRHDSRVAPQTVQTASPVCGTKNFSSVRLYSPPQIALHNCRHPWNMRFGPSIFQPNQAVRLVPKVVVVRLTSFSIARLRSHSLCNVDAIQIIGDDVDIVGFNGACDVAIRPD